MLQTCFKRIIRLLLQILDCFESILRISRVHFMEQMLLTEIVVDHVRYALIVIIKRWGYIDALELIVRISAA